MSLLQVSLGDVFFTSILFVTAYIVATIFVYVNFIQMPVNRLNTIDGLRGYLAFSVFIHHSIIWYFYLKSGVWQLPPLRFYSQIGQASVSLFFMITAFLFWGKLLRVDNKKFEWDRYFLSRVLRLGPLYIFVIFLMFLIVASLSKFELRDSIINIFIACFRWLGFQILGKPNINGIRDTFTIVAGATWTLPYEWLFYLLLPIVALFIQVKSRPLNIFLCILMLSIFAFSNIKIYLLTPFCFGMLSAYLFNRKILVSLLNSHGGSILACICLGIVVSCFDSPYNLLPMLLLFFAFYAIVCGANLFGILDSSASRLLGDISYSVYLLHGVLLFLYFKLVPLNFPVVESSFVFHGAGVLLLVPFLVSLSCLSYRYIELPAINSVGGFIKILRNCRIF